MCVNFFIFNSFCGRLSSIENPENYLIKPYLDVYECFGRILHQFFNHSVDNVLNLSELLIVKAIS